MLYLAVFVIGVIIGAVSIIGLIINVDMTDV